jgi:hypothetical protein
MRREEFPNLFVHSQENPIFTHTHINHPLRRREMKRNLISLITLSILFFLFGSKSIIFGNVVNFQGQNTFFENFDEQGQSWTNTIFTSVFHAQNSASFTREPVGNELKAPNTTPPLPINQGGDKEAHFANRECYITMPGEFTDVVIDGYIALCAPSVENSGEVAGRFVARESWTGSTSNNAYQAEIMGATAYQGVLFIERVNGGVTRPEDMLFTSQWFPADFMTGTENYHMRFSAIGNSLTAELWTVRVVNGILTEIPVDLLSAGGTQNKATVFDSTYTSGQVGLAAFVGTPYTALYMDDITITVVPEPATLLLLGLGAIFLRKKRHFDNT